jgi:hypothetical protein
MQYNLEHFWIYLKKKFKIQTESKLYLEYRNLKATFDNKIALIAYRDA